MINYPKDTEGESITDKEKLLNLIEEKNFKPIYIEDNRTPLNWWDKLKAKALSLTFIRKYINIKAYSNFNEWLNGEDEYLAAIISISVVGKQVLYREIVFTRKGLN